MSAPKEIVQTSSIGSTIGIAKVVMLLHQHQFVAFAIHVELSDVGMQEQAQLDSGIFAPQEQRIVIPSSRITVFGQMFKDG